MAEADRDQKVTQAYRALGAEEPPRALDEAILAASRRSRVRWRVPLSIAAVLVLAVGVTLRMLPPQPDAESVALAPQVIQTPRPASVPAEPPAKPALDAVRSTAEPPRPDIGVARSDAGAPAPAPAAAESAPRLGAMNASTASRREAAAAAPAAPRAADEARRESVAGAPAGASARVPAAAKLSEPALTPEAWLERIAEMRKQGREREAQESLAEFKKRYPDYKIPEALTR
jgi:hypothetical protein